MILAHCYICKLSLPKEEFGKSVFYRPRFDRWAGTCKKCAVIVQFKHSKTEKGRITKKRADTKYKIGKEKYYQHFSKAWVLRTKYNMTHLDLQNLTELQKGCCAICQEIPKRRLVIDHCHISGKVRGLLCDPCNLALGKFKDNIQTIKNALKYLIENLWGGGGVI